MGAFLDLERIEVLRGPQPLAFGQNATAGAFSLTTKKPTSEWEGDITSEYGNWGRFSLEGGVGGPITDTLGIRVAGQYDKTDGYLKDIITSDKFPAGEETAARITLAWNPMENLQATFKAEWAQRRNQAEGISVCRTEGLVEQTERAVTIPGQTSFAPGQQDIINLPRDCDKSFRRKGLMEGRTPLIKPIQGIDQEDSRGGIVDITTVSATVMDKLDAHDDMDAFNYRIGVDYEFANGISLMSNTGYIDYERSSAHDNSSSPIITNVQHRGEIFDEFSQEIRVSSPRGGQIEWEFGGFYQDEDLDIGNLGDPKFQTITLRANIRRPARSQDAWQDSRWLSGFAGFTFNFLDDQASLDVGARYTDIKKTSHIQGYAHTWIYDVDPDGPGDINPGDGTVQGTDHDNNCVGPSGGIARCTDRIRTVGGIGPGENIIDCSDLSDPRTQGTRNQCGQFAGMAGYWTHAYNVTGTRTVPEAWDTISPVALGPPVWGIRAQSGNNLVYDRPYSDSSFDPQVTLRYRPTDTLSLYAKWARAFKGGGADISTASLPADQDAFPLDAEKAENFEIGAKGTLLSGAANYNITAFQISIDDLQIATAVPAQLDTQSSISTNASKQRTRGIEMDARWAATDQLTLGMSAAFMDGTMVRFQGAGCTDAEFELADEGPCISEDGFDANPDGFPAGTIDRSGARAPRTPVYKIIADIDWWYPVTDRVKYTFSSKTSLIDAYIYNVQDFDKTISFGDRIIQNLTIGLADMEDRWSVTLWGRNLLSEGFKYFPEFDVLPEGRIDKEVSQRHWFSYGLQFQYNYN